MHSLPAGEEREVRRLGGTTLDGAPIAYVVALASVVLAFAFVPLSVVLGSGKSFPMSQAIYPLVGWILGPVAGAVADGVGALLGVFIAPHTTAMPIATVIGAVMGGLAAGLMAEDRRRAWRMAFTAFSLLIYLLYVSYAVLHNRAALGAVLLGSLIDSTALLLYILPTRTLCARWIGEGDVRRVALGAFGGTWMASGLAHLGAATLFYLIANWPNAVWLAMAPVAPLEHLVRSLVGAVVGAGVITGLRAVNLVRPQHALY